MFRILSFFAAYIFDSKMNKLRISFDKQNMLIIKFYLSLTG